MLSKLKRIAVMRTHYLALSTLALCGIYLVFKVEYLSGAINAYIDYLDDEVGVFPWVIGCTGFVKIFLAIFYLVRRKLPTLRCLSTRLASIQIYIGTTLDVLVCYGSLLRINLSYLYLAIFPLIAISFFCVLCMRHSRLSGRVDVKPGSSTAGTDNGKKSTVMPEKFNIEVVLNNGLKNRVMSEEFNIVVLMAPHLILCVSGMVGDPDHDGNNYDVSNLFLFFTCILQDLTLIMTRLSTTISRSTAPVSELLYKASLVVLLLTAHILVVNTFGKKAVLLLLPEVVPPLLWFSLHLDRHTPIINVHNIVASEHFVFKAVLVAMCGCVVQVIPKDEPLLYWASMACAASGLITYIIVLVLRLWPEKCRFATLSFEEVLELLTFWGQLLLQVAAGLFSFASADLVYRLLV